MGKKQTKSSERPYFCLIECENQGILKYEIKGKDQNEAFEKLYSVIDEMKGKADIIMAGLLFYTDQSHVMIAKNKSQRRPPEIIDFFKKNKD